MRHFIFCLCIFSIACSSQTTRRTASSTGAFEQATESASACKPLDNEKRKLILSLASPENFQKTRYRKGPREGRNIEREADCSTFVHEIYRRAGLPFHFQSTRNLRSAPEFVEIPEDSAAPGDLMVFRGHVGIVDENGKIISATRNRKSHRITSSIKKYDRSVFRGYRTALRYHCVNTPSSFAQNP